MPPESAVLPALPRAALFATMELGKGLGMKSPHLDTEEKVLRADGINLVIDHFGDMFPGLQPSGAHWRSKQGGRMSGGVADAGA